jgi:hypothetical protein
VGGVALAGNSRIIEQLKILTKVHCTSRSKPEKKAFQPVAEMTSYLIRRVVVRLHPATVGQLTFCLTQFLLERPPDRPEDRPAPEEDRLEGRDERMDEPDREEGLVERNVGVDRVEGRLGLTEGAERVLDRLVPELKPRFELEGALLVQDDPRLVRGAIDRELVSPERLVLPE